MNAKMNLAVMTQKINRHRAVLAAGLVTAGLAVAGPSSPAAAFQGEILSSCIAKRDGGIYSTKTCRKGDKAVKLERPNGGAVEVTAFADGKVDECTVMRELFFDGSDKTPDGAVCVGIFINPTYGNRYCGVWFEIDAPVAVRHMTPGAGVDNNDLVRGDEVTGEQTGITRAKIAFVVRGFPASQPRLDFMTEDGFLVTTEETVVSWDFGVDGCWATSRISSRRLTP